MLLPPLILCFNHKMTDEKDELKRLSEIQSRLYTVEELLASQHSKQEQLTLEMLTFANDVICELRLLSLVRSTIIDSELTVDVYPFIKSQTMQGLTFSALEYCPTFFESNLLNHYMTFISLIRTKPEILSKALYHMSIKNPEKIYSLAYSVFLTLFQQCWCVEEDTLLYQTLCEFADYQFSLKQQQTNKNIQYQPNPNFSRPLTTPESILASLYPFSTFVTAYLFNGASFAYLQCALSQIVSILHSSSSLRGLHNHFTQTDDGTLAPFEYWTFIVHHAVECFNSLVKCMELLPIGVAHLFKHIRNHPLGGDDTCILLFFESFVNRALDRPAVLGLVPWHPDSSEWSPSKDISYVFRAKYNEKLPSRFFDPLHKILELIPEFKNEMKFDQFLDALTNVDTPHTILMSETELLSTNPLFPKELVITGKDICLLHEAALTIPKEYRTDEAFERALTRLGAVPQINELAEEHFRIVLQRQKEITKAAKLLRPKSLFDISTASTVKMKDPFAEYFCDVIAQMPNFSDFTNFLNPDSATTFLTQMEILAPHFINKDNLLQTDAVLYYAIHSTSSINELLPRLDVVADFRHTSAMEAADKTSSLNTQHQRMSEACTIVKAMRENVQSHLLYIIANTLVHDKISKEFQIVMSKSYGFITDFDSFNNSSIHIMELAAQLSTNLGMNPTHVAQIARILFFNMTEYVTCKRFLVSDETTWKRSVIITNIVKKHKTTLVDNLLKTWHAEFDLRKKYLERAADLLGHIRPTSGISVILYYVDEFVSTIKQLTKECARTLSLDSCILWVMLNTNAYQLYGVGKFISHFLLGNSFVDTLLTSKEIQHLGVFSSAICMLLRACEPYDKRIDSNWD